MGDRLKQELISAVFPHKAIWDQQHADHHNRFKLERLWKEVAKKCGTTINVAKKKWKTLRQQFKEKYEKLPAPTAGLPAPEETIEWPYFMPLLFLRDNFQCNTTSGHSNSAVAVDETVEIGENNGDSDEVDNPPTPNSEASASIPQITIRCVSPSSSAEADDFRKRARTTDKLGYRLIEIEKEKLRMCKERESLSSYKRDEDIAFFTSLLPHVRRMSPLSKMTFRIEVQKLVMERAYGVGYGSLESTHTNQNNP